VPLEGRLDPPAAEIYTKLFMRIRFAKMQALGNDFVVIDGVRQDIDLSPQQARAVADRHFGIGCDQVLMAQTATAPEVDFRFRIWNADGGEVAQCGNGARCFARFVTDEGLTTKKNIVVETGAGQMTLSMDNTGMVTVNMGVPRFEPDQVPFQAPNREAVYDLDVNGRNVEITALSLGNPHAVQLVDDVDRAPVATDGPRIESHPRFPQRVNAGYVQVVDRSHVRVRVYERGAGETLACGSGACAAVVAGRVRGLLDETVQVELRGGTLTVTWAGEEQPVYMTGPAVRVFDGELDLAEMNR